MKVGLFGGAFDPVHLGHLNCANQAARRFGLDTVYFIPTAIPPHKRSKGASAVDRLEMVTKAIRSNPGFKVSRLEMADNRPSYTIDTVKRFRKKFGRLYYIAGMDAFREMHLWKAAGELLSLCNFIVVSRPGTGIEDTVASSILGFRATGIELRREKGEKTKSAPRVLRAAGSPFRIFFFESVALDISSTEIRHMIARGNSIKYLVPEPVEQCIIKRRIYLR
jgi:nicotinate-nucleotide adenylyltransferase